MKKIITTEQLREATAKTHLNFEVLAEYRFTVKKLKEFLEQYPDEMMIGLKFNSNDQIRETSQCPLTLSEGRIVYDGFDGYYSYRGLTDEKVPFLQINVPYDANRFISD
jgi:hypothetical protein